MIEFSTPINKTKILPLRWFANGCERIANYYLKLYLRYEDPEVEESLTPTRAKIYGRISSLFYKPYFKWGTTYKVDMDAWKEYLQNDPVLDKLGSDYDEDCIPYWVK